MHIHNACMCTSHESHQCMNDTPCRHMHITTWCTHRHRHTCITPHAHIHIHKHSHTQTCMHTHTMDTMCTWGGPFIPAGYKYKCKYHVQRHESYAHAAGKSCYTTTATCLACRHMCRQHIHGKTPTCKWCSAGKAMVQTATCLACRGCGGSTTDRRRFTCG